jgi:hypothetical protein
MVVPAKPPKYPLGFSGARGLVPNGENEAGFTVLDDADGGEVAAAA